jgi:cephalosporin hydroxylase
MNEFEKFNVERQKNIDKLGRDIVLKKIGTKVLSESVKYNYSYNFDWMLRPIIQYPQDIVAFQEIVWSVKPDLIIEMGIAHGGSLILSASLLAMLDLCEHGQTTLKPHSEQPRRVVAVDIDIREHNRTAIQEHPLYPRIKLIEGSSIDKNIIEQVKKEAEGHKKILICLDSNHTHDHVLAELEAYAPLTSKESYCLVFDTVIEDMPKEMHNDRTWGPGNNPKTAVYEYLKNHPEFEIDKNIQHKLLITVAPDGYLKRIE